MKNLIMRLTATGILLTFPLLASAQLNVNTTKISEALRAISDLIGIALPIIIALAVLLFIWGLLKYILSSGNEDKQKEARSLMIWGVIILFVMVSVWGLVGILSQVTGVNGTAVPALPALPQPR